jgi:hypothetical protein
MCDICLCLPVANEDLRTANAFNDCLKINFQTC